MYKIAPGGGGLKPAQGLENYILHFCVIWGDLFSSVNIYGPVIAYLENITNLEILPYLLHFSEVLKRILNIK